MRKCHRHTTYPTSFRCKSRCSTFIVRSITCTLAALAQSPACLQPQPLAHTLAAQLVTHSVSRSTYLGVLACRCSGQNRPRSPAPRALLPAYAASPLEPRARIARARRAHVSCLLRMRCSSRACLSSSSAPRIECALHPPYPVNFVRKPILAIRHTTRCRPASVFFSAYPLIPSIAPIALRHPPSAAHPFFTPTHRRGPHAASAQ